MSSRACFFIRNGDAFQLFGIAAIYHGGHFIFTMIFTMLTKNIAAICHTGAALPQL